jgi:SDR family mycofactocin-dependent oxidoreductase
MAGRLEGKVALISGAARGQGRSHAVRLAQEGADIIAFDVCRQLPTVGYKMATPEDLKETAKQVEDLDRRIIAREADVRDGAAVRALVEEGVAELGRLDIVSANAGIATFSENAWSMEDDVWEETIAVNLTGVWKTLKAAIPAMIDAGNGGAIVITSSTAGIKGMAGIAHYDSSKHGVVGLMRTLAKELGPRMIRVNSLHPTNVDTPMFTNETMRRLWVPYKDDPTADDVEAVARAIHVLPVGWVEMEDVTNAVLFLASDESRYVTGVPLPIDAGFLAN